MRPQRLLPLILCMCGDSGGTSMSSATNVTTVDPANTGETTQTPPTSGASTSGESAEAGTTDIIKLDTPDGVSEAGRSTQSPRDRRARSTPCSATAVRCPACAAGTTR